MRVSLNTIKQYTAVDLSVDQLVVKINQQLGRVEHVIDLNNTYKDAVIAKVVSCEKHPNADKLLVCTIDAGDSTPNSHFPVPDPHAIQVVCGASNVRAGLFVVWLPPGSTVPATAGDAEPFVLEARELRGVVSNGMIASAKELAIGDSHDGILEIIDSDLPPTTNYQSLIPGMNFAQAFGLNDTIIDIENKMFTHRPDLFGQLGVAREIAGIQHKPFTSPDWYQALPEFNGGEGLDLTVKNDASDVVPRFMAVAIADVMVKPSPFWLQCELVRLGGKPINNIVDVTNYVMLLSAQPTHAYDYDKLRGNTLGTRTARSGEMLTLLNGKTYELDETDIVIVDGDGPVGLAGIMGGGNSEVSADTTNLVLEVANFDMYAVRKSSMRHGIFTDALTRFNKGQSSLQNPYVMSLLMQSMFDVVGGKQASDVFDEKNDKVQEREHASRNDKVLLTSTEFIAQRLGLKLEPQDVISLLTNVEFEVETGPGIERIDVVRDGRGTESRDVVETSEPLAIFAPFWRTDIEIKEDIVEEVGRLYGFDKLPRELPKRTITPAPQNPLTVTKQRIRETLSHSGANEVLTYSFVHENTLRRAGQDAVHAFRLSNALSPDLQYYRLSIIPSLLDKVHMNLRAGHDQFSLFEIGKVHFKGEMDAGEPNLPNEDNHVALVIAYADKQKPAGAAYYHARRYLEQITDLSGVRLQPMDQFDLTTDEWGAQLASAYDPKRSALVVKDEQIYGIVGEFKREVRGAFKLPGFVAGFEINMDILRYQTESYTPLSRFPSVSQDVSLQVSDQVAYADIFRLSHDALHHNSTRHYDLSLLAIYQPKDTSTKTITLRLKVTDQERTLTDSDVAQDIAAITAATAELGAKQI